MTDRLNEETESRRKTADKLSHERHTSQKEKETTQEVGAGLKVTSHDLRTFSISVSCVLSLSVSVAD